MPRPVSKRQARFFGAIASGDIKLKNFSPSEARTRLRGTRITELPETAPSARRNPTRTPTPRQVNPIRRRRRNS